MISMSAPRPTYFLILNELGILMVVDSLDSNSLIFGNPVKSESNSSIPFPHAALATLYFGIREYTENKPSFLMKNGEDRRSDVEMPDGRMEIFGFNA